MPEQPPKSWEKAIQEKLIREREEQFGDYGVSIYGGKICGLGGYALLKLLGESNKDLVVGYPIAEWVKQNPLADAEDYTISLMLSPNKIPPFSKTVTVAGKRKTINPVQITIPSPIVDLTYSKIRYACGDNDGLPWGNYIARAYVSLTDSAKRFGQRQVVCRGQSGAGAIRNLDRVLSLYDIGKGKILDKRVAYSDTDGQQNKRDMYPAWLWVYKPSLIDKPEKMEKTKIMIFSETEPKSFKEQLAAVL